MHSKLAVNDQTLFFNTDFYNLLFYVEFFILNS